METESFHWLPVHFLLSFIYFPDLKARQFLKLLLSGNVSPLLQSKIRAVLLARKGKLPGNKR